MVLTRKQKYENSPTYGRILYFISDEFTFVHNPVSHAEKGQLIHRGNFLNLFIFLKNKSIVPPTDLYNYFIHVRLFIFGVVVQHSGGDRTLKMYVIRNVNFFIILDISYARKIPDYNNCRYGGTSYFFPADGRNKNTRIK